MPNRRRELILQSAVQLFNANGYHATSMQDVANAASIKKPTLYHYFNSKEDILLTILDDSMDRLVAHLSSIADSDLEPISKLRQAIRAHAVAIAENPESAAIFLREDRGLGKEYLDLYVGKRDRFEEIFREIVEQGIREGTFREIDVAVTVKGVLGMTNWLTRWYRVEGRLGAEEIADLFSNLMLDGLRVTEPLSRANT